MGIGARHISQLHSLPLIYTTHIVGHWVVDRTVTLVLHSADTKAEIRYGGEI